MQLTFHSDVSYGDNGLAPLVTAPYGAYQNGSYFLIGGQPNAVEFPPMWYSTVDNGLQEFVDEVIQRNEWKSQDPRGENQVYR